MAVFGKKSESEKEEPAAFTRDTERVTDTTPGKKNSVIGKTLSIKGKLFSDEEVLVEGKIEGKLKVENRVIIGESGKLNADIDAREVLIKGTVNGNVSASYKVEIIPDGTLNGNIVAQRVVLAEGAVFKGSVDMTTDDKKIR